MATRLLVQDLVVGTELGHYQVVEVYRARDEHLARDVAIKVSETHHICGVRQGPTATARIGAASGPVPEVQIVLHPPPIIRPLCQSERICSPQMGLLTQRSRSPFHVLADYARV